MMEVTRTQLRPGVRLTAVRTEKFKSSVLGMQFLSPLAPETAALNALLPAVLRRGTAAHPDMERLSAALDELYGGTLEPTVRKKGETQCVGFVGSFLDDAYTLDGSAVLEPAAALLGELALEPWTRDGAFCPDYTRQERDNLVDRIRAQVNDKRQYAQLRVVAEMCRDEPLGMRPPPPPSPPGPCGTTTRACCAPRRWSSTTAAPPPSGGWRRRCAPSRTACPPGSGRRRPAPPRGAPPPSPAGWRRPWT